MAILNRVLRSVLFLSLITSLMTLAGCSESPLDAVENSVPVEDEFLVSGKDDPGANGRDIAAWARKLQGYTKKARNFHLLDRAIIYGGAGKSMAGEDSVRLLVGFSSSNVTADSVLATVLNKYKILNRFEFKAALHGMAVTLPASTVDSFVAYTGSSPDVGWTEPDASVPTGVGSAGSTVPSTQQIPWSIPSIGADLSHTISGDGTGSVGVDLYILDTGANSSDLNIVECLEFPRKLGAVPCTSTIDEDGHGTEVAHVAAALDNTAGIVGVAPGARIHVLKVMREYGNTVLGSLIAVVDYLTKRKLANPSVPMVVNISLGSNVRTTRYNGLDEAIRSSIAAGVVYVISAGNDGINTATVSPAHVPEAITVGAYTNASMFASFSNYGAAIDILAPGENVLTMAPNGSLVYTSGTSIAAPHVAGAAALLLAQNPSLTPAQVRDQLLLKARANITGVPSQTTNKSLYVGP